MKTLIFIFLLFPFVCISAQKYQNGTRLLKGAEVLSNTPLQLDYVLEKLNDTGNVTNLHEGKTHLIIDDGSDGWSEWWYIRGKWQPKQTEKNQQSAIFIDSDTSRNVKITFPYLAARYSEYEQYLYFFNAGLTYRSSYKTSQENSSITITADNIGLNVIASQVSGGNFSATNFKLNQGSISLNAHNIEIISNNTLTFGSYGSGKTTLGEIAKKGAFYNQANSPYVPVNSFAFWQKSETEYYLIANFNGTQKLISFQ